MKSAFSIKITVHDHATVNGVALDFIQHGKDRDLYMNICDDPGGFPKDLFQKIEKATTTPRPFYDNIYFLFSIGRICNYVEDLRKLGTVAVVELRSFFGKQRRAFRKAVTSTHTFCLYRYGGTGM